jgi:hypothetical protein
MKMITIGDSVASLEVRNNADGTGREVEVWATKRVGLFYGLMGYGVFGLPSGVDEAKFYKERLYPLFVDAPITYSKPNRVGLDVAGSLKRAEAHIRSHNSNQPFESKVQSVLPFEGLAKILGAESRYLVILADVYGVTKRTAEFMRKRSKDHHNKRATK